MDNGFIIGLLAGCGALLLYSSFWPSQGAPKRTNRGLRHRLNSVGINNRTLGLLLSSGVILGLVMAFVLLIFTKAWAISLLGFLLATTTPVVLSYNRKLKTTAARRQLWPVVIDQLLSAIRAGIDLPIALGQLANRGPKGLQSDFQYFKESYQLTGDFELSINALKDRLADPVADRIIESLKIARTVGGSDIGNLLRTLARFVRADLQIRGEIKARQSWTETGAKVAVCAPWLVLLLLSTRSGGLQAFNSTSGALLLFAGALVLLGAYLLMKKLGALRTEKRTLI